MQPTAGRRQRQAEPGPMEYSTVIHCIHYCAHWQGAPAACNERDSPSHSGRRKAHTEHPERYYYYQELRRTEYYPAERSQLQRR
jgi:hypothetical protein